MKRTPIKIDPSDHPDVLAEYLTYSAVFDSSCSSEAKVFFIDKDDGYFLKTAAEGALRTESLMTKYMNSLRLSAEVLYYGSFRGKDYLLTRRIPGEDCTYAEYLSDPKRLCDTTAMLLRDLHGTDTSNCPVRDKIKTYKEAVTKGLDGLHYEPELFRGLWGFPSFGDAVRTASEGLPLLKKEILLHGDYCLPNIILNNWRFSGYIDLGNSGLGDRHIDILWGIWTLNYNLGTIKYSDRFMDAYGRDMIDPDMLRMVAAMEMIGG